MKKDLTKHTRSAWKQPVWWKYIVAFFIILINALPLYVLIEMSLKQSTDLASRLTWPDYIYLGNYLKILKNAGQSNLLNAFNVGDAVFQFGQSNFNLSSAALCGMVVLVAIQSEIAGDFSEKRSQSVRPLRGNTVPRTQISVVDAFFRIKTVIQNIVSDGVTVTPVFFSRCRYCALFFCPIQGNNFLIVHNAPFRCATSFHL